MLDYLISSSRSLGTVEWNYDFFWNSNSTCNSNSKLECLPIFFLLFILNNFYCSVFNLLTLPLAISNLLLRHIQYIFHLLYCIFDYRIFIWFHFSAEIPHLVTMTAYFSFFRHLFTIYFKVFVK